MSVFLKSERTPPFSDTRGNHDVFRPRMTVPLEKRYFIMTAKRDEGF